MSMKVIRSIRITMNLVLLGLAILQISGVINISPTLLVVLASIVLISIFFTRWKEAKDERENPDD
ncbi:hypothetical protein [Alkalicoccobacillus porphyridii]|uniref:Uncharacterized protein n=1 Tax=Alkalicoccobacillus porphyridii TaxID=2597270 RepID=A0A554A1R9_9BACI|nr:hypothetical protein [Alkalicoccobacillus porphyridii]TSB47632.1 hypothetical protein FN960_03670 [Alkalicoccobacillus porphyridii]